MSMPVDASTGLPTRYGVGAAADDEPGDPAESDDEAEADDPVQHDGGDGGGGVHPARDQAQDEGAVDDAQTARDDRDTGGGHPGAEGQQQLRSANRAVVEGAETHPQAHGVEQPVEDGEGTGGRGVRRRQPGGAQLVDEA